MAQSRQSDLAKIWESPFGFFARAYRSRINSTLVAFVSLRCAGHHKKTHLNGIVVLCLRFVSWVAEPNIHLRLLFNYVSGRPAND
jgi:hypothetical protein